MRLLWRIMREFNLPINDPRLQSMTQQQMELMLWGLLSEDPKYNSKDVYHDPDFDEYWSEHPKMEDDKEDLWEEV